MKDAGGKRSAVRKLWSLQIGSPEIWEQGMGVRIPLSLTHTERVLRLRLEPVRVLIRVWLRVS